ncbi:ABC transporter substrate-binding protein [Natrarchaeobius chitinivorans]|uniref:ABC transporter substrate-binding protein n=1 Tax=Natrarchaeobius chitinivorans TaxID=1679083 RepID=UPI000F53DA6A|nr:ABC transporter substrate-binding protein [Natrarchaeobius chitinivorans]
MALDDVSMEDVQGPVIDRRTSMKLLGAAGLAGLAGCTGDENGENGGNGGNGGNGNGGNGNGGAPSSGGVARIGLNQDHMEQGDAARIWGESEWPIQFHVYNSLLRLNENQEIEGELAEDWHNPDDSTYEFELRDDVDFHNGDHFTAEDVRWHIERIEEMDDTPYNEVDAIESIEVPDDYTIRISLEEPYVPFIVYLMAPEGVGTITNQTAYEDDPEHYQQYPVGTGPFELTDRTPGESVTLEAFDDYWDTDDDGNSLPYLDGIEYQFIPEPSTMWTAVSSGELDLVNENSYDRADAIENHDDLVLDTMSKGAYKSIQMLCNDAASDEWEELAQIVAPDREVTDKWEDEDLVTDDPRVRRAIALAIDRQEVVDTAWFGYGEPAHSMLVPTMGPFFEREPENAQQYDPEEAERLLDEAGYTGDPRFTVSMLGWQTAWTERFAVVLQEQLADVGIEAEIDIRSGSEAFDVLLDFEHELFLYAAANLFTATNHMNNMFMTPVEGAPNGSRNRQLWRDEEFDELSEAAMTTPDIDERSEYIREAEQILLEGTPHAWVVHDDVVRARNANLQGIDQVALMERLHTAYFAD